MMEGILFALIFCFLVFVISACVAGIVERFKKSSGQKITQTRYKEVNKPKQLKRECEEMAK